MNKIVLSAFACDPTKGSEPANGWNWSVGLVKKGFEVHCFTRNISKKVIEEYSIPENLTFHYIKLPFGLEKLYSSSKPGMYLYYVLWQWIAYRAAKRVHRKIYFDLAHHVTWGSTQMGSFMYKLGIPFIFGPAGGGQIAPEAFKKYFLNFWEQEKNREKVTRLMLKYNPACKEMLKKAHMVLVSNPDTFEMVKNAGAKHISHSLDTTLPESFFPEHRIMRQEIGEGLRLLWVGRFLSRKGILLLLDVMKELKNNENIILTVVGDGEMRDDFVNTIKEYELNKTVNWKGQVAYNEVKDFYLENDVFIFTSLRDSGGLQLIEAMAYSMPVITINLHGQAIIVNDETGIVCDCETPEIAIAALKNAVLEFYYNRKLIAAKGLEAYKFARKQTWNNKIDMIVDQYYPKSS